MKNIDSNDDLFNNPGPNIDNTPLHAGYNSEDDLENQKYLVITENKHNSDISPLLGRSESNIMGNEKEQQEANILVIEKEIKGEGYLCKNAMNIISLILLLLGMLVPIIYCIINDKFELLHSYFTPKTGHFQMNFTVFMIECGLIYSNNPI